MFFPELLTENKTNVNLYPNPTTGTFSVDFVGEITTVEIFMLNFQGNVVFENKCKDQLKMDIDIGHLAAGIYIIAIKTQRDIITKKVIKNY